MNMKRKRIAVVIIAAVLIGASLVTACSRVDGPGTDEAQESDTDIKELTSDQIRDILAAAMSEDKRFTKDNIDSVKTKKSDGIVEDCMRMDEEQIRAYVKRLGEVGLKDRVFSEENNGSYPRIRDAVLEPGFVPDESLNVESLELLLKQARSSREFYDKLSELYGSADYSYRYTSHEGQDQYWLDDTGSECIVFKWTLYENYFGEEERDFIIEWICLENDEDSGAENTLYSCSDLDSLFKDEIRYSHRHEMVRRVLREAIGENEGYFGEGAARNISDFALDAMTGDCRLMNEAQIRSYIDCLVKNEIKFDIGCGAGAGYPRICAKILGIQSADTPRLTAEAYDRLVRESRDDEELRDRIYSQYGSPDHVYLFSGRVGGVEEYWLDDKGTESVCLEFN